MNVSPDYAGQRELERRELERQANKLLHRGGYTTVGLPRRSCDPSQVVFERLQLCTPTGGKQGYRLR